MNNLSIINTAIETIGTIPAATTVLSFAIEATSKERFLAYGGPSASLWGGNGRLSHALLANTGRNIMQYGGSAYLGYNALKRIPNLLNSQSHYEETYNALMLGGEISGLLTNIGVNMGCLFLAGSLLCFGTAGVVALFSRDLAGAAKSATEATTVLGMTIFVL